jgi:hypothetical protein
MSSEKFEIVDLGVWHPDYFNGFGVSFTKFEHGTYGIGDTAQEAYQDALDSAAQFSPWAAIDLDAMPEHCPFSGSVPDVELDDDEKESGDYRSYYHVGIRWNTQ